MRFFYRLRSAGLLAVGFALLACMPADLHAQTGILTGRVIDAESKRGLPGVNVQIEDTNLGASTAPDGRFEVRNVPTGTQTVVASFVGYQTVRREVRVREGRSTQIQIALSQKAVEAGGVTVLGYRKYASKVSGAGLKFSAPIQDVPQSVQMITGDFLEDQGAERLKDVFRNVSGVNAFSTYQDFTIRGFRSFEVLYNGLKASGYDPFVNPKMTHVERVEVIKGPASVLYGQLEPGGMINVVTKDPQAESLQRFSLTGGSYSRIQGTADLTGSLGDDNWMYRLTGSVEDRSSFRRHQEFTNFQVAPALTWTPGSRTQITLKGTYYQDNRDGQRNRGIAAPSGNLDALPIEWTANEPTDFADGRGYTAELNLNHQFSDSWRTRSMFRAGRGNYDEGYHEPRGMQDVDGRTMLGRQYRDSEFDNMSYGSNVNLIGNFSTGSVAHELLVGGDLLFGGRDTDAKWASEGVSPLDVFDPQYGNVSPQNRTFGLEFNIEIDERELGVYAQDLITLLPSLKVLVGGRYDDFQAEQVRTINGDTQRPESNHQAFTLRGGLIYQPTNDVSLYGSYSEGFKPQAANLQSFGGPFDPERSWQVEGGTKVSFFEDRLNATLAGYHILKENVLVRDPDADSFQYTQAGEVTSQGVELDVIGSLQPNWSLVANYSYNLTEIAEHTDPDQQGLTLPNAPEHSVGLWTRYDILPIDLGVAGGISYVGERRTPDETTLPSYAVVDAALYYQWRTVELALNVNNVFDERHFIGGVSRVALFPGQPRSFSLRATIEL
jgi:iron complex outermembrane receptor protein